MMNSRGFPFASMARFGDRPAVRRAGRSIGYRELTDLSADLAGRIAPGQVVAVRGDRLDHVVGLLASLRTGGTYLPLETGDPEDRTAALLAEAGAGTVVTGGVPEPGPGGGPAGPGY